MARKLLILCLFLAGVFTSGAQVIKRTLLSANSFSFKHSIYVYGYEQKNDLLSFKCYAYDLSLQLKDSAGCELGKHTISDFLESSVDTIHEVISFYFQLANQKNTVSLFRVNEHLKEICFVKEYDANHINSMTAFEAEKYTVKNALYIIRSSGDTAEKQFYLSKYQLKELNKPFEYDFKWQFAFERDYIHRATVLYADSSAILVYAHVNDGIKKGQWILRINAETGALIKGTRLNTKIDQRLFLASALTVNKITGNVTVAGSIYNADQINFKDSKSNFTTLYKTHKLFLVHIDTSGEVIQRVEKLFPMPIQTKTANGLMSFHIKLREFKETPAKGFDLWADVYEMSKPNTLCYYSSWHIKMTPDDVDYTFELSPFYISSSAVPSFISFTKGDTYGKFELNSINEYDRFKYKQATNPVIVKTEVDELNNPYYILKKTDILKSTGTWYYVFKGPKALEKKVLLKSEQGQKAVLYFITGKKYISFNSSINQNEFELTPGSL